MYDCDQQITIVGIFFTIPCLFRHFVTDVNKICIWNKNT